MEPTVSCQTLLQESANVGLGRVWEQHSRGRRFWGSPIPGPKAEQLDVRRKIGAQTSDLDDLLFIQLRSWPRSRFCRSGADPPRCSGSGPPEPTSRPSSEPDQRSTLQLRALSAHFRAQRHMVGLRAGRHQIWAGFDSGFGRIWPDLGQLWADLDHCCAGLRHIRLSSTRFDANWVETDQVWTASAKFGASAANLNSARFAADRASANCVGFGESRTRRGQI